MVERISINFSIVKSYFFDKVRFGYVAVVVLLGIYIINLFTPLRLTNDTVRYFAIKEWLESGAPSDSSPASRDFLPYGYVILLLSLSKLHLLQPFFITAINFLYLLGAVFFVSKIFGKQMQWPWLFLLTLLNWVSLKFVITPLSEMQYLFFSAGAIFLFTRYQHEKKLIDLVALFVFCSAAILTRTVGIVLLPAIAISIVWENRNVLRVFLNKNKIKVLMAVAVFITIVLLAKQLKITRYLNYLITPLRDNPFLFVVNNIYLHLIDWAELFINTPSPKLSFINKGFNRFFYLITGVFSLIAIFVFLFKKANNISTIMKLYLTIYIITIFCWPYYEARFWAPLLPFLFAIIVLQINKLSGAKKNILKASLSVYSLIGIIALSYYTITSLSKKTLAVKQDAGKWRVEYETYFFGKQLGDSTRSSNLRVLKLLEKYN